MRGRDLDHRNSGHGFEAGIRVDHFCPSKGIAKGDKAGFFTVDRGRIHGTKLDGAGGNAKGVERIALKKRLIDNL